MMAPSWVEPIQVGGAPSSDVGDKARAPISSARDGNGSMSGREATGVVNGAKVLAELELAGISGGRSWASCTGSGPREGGALGIKLGIEGSMDD
jgi:hypothetical protein